MRYSCSDLALAGCGQDLPSVTLEFFGSVNWTIAFLLSVNPRFGFDIGHVVGERVGVHRPIIDSDLARIGVEPGQGGLVPVLVFAFGEILAPVSAAACGAVEGRYH